MGCWLCRGQGSSQPAAAHGSERSSFRLTSSGTPQWRLRQLHRRPGGFSARLPALELQPRQGVHGRCGSTFLCAVFVGLVHRQPAGHSVFQAHRLHLFQRLHQAGWPHARVSLTTIAATAVLAVAMLAGGWPWVFGLAVVELLVGVWLDQRVAVPFAVASQS